MPSGPRPTAKVWDPLIRIGHWALVASVAAAWLTRSGWGAWHEWIGYCALALVLIRLAWGWIGPGYARFEQFVRGPAATLNYACCALSAQEPRHVGHNPLGAWMILALLATTAIVCITGWAYTTDAYWGNERVEDLHDGAAIALLVLAALHVVGVAVASLRHGENLVGSMLHGRKRPPAGDDVA